MTETISGVLVLGQRRVWDWEFTWEILPEFLGGPLITTIQATVLGSVVALTLGLAFAVARRSESKLVSWPTIGIIDFVRSTPLLVQLFFLFFGLPAIGVTLSPLTAGVIGLGVHYATYTSEVYRAGINEVAKGQWEAARALNLSIPRTWRRVIIPQAIPKVTPALGNYLVAMFKETPLLSAILVIELIAQANTISFRTYRSLEPYTIVAILYLIMSYVSVMGIRRLEIHFAARY